MNAIVTKEQLVSDIKRIGVKQGDLLNVKVSYKSIGNVEGGVNTVIEALLDVVGKSGTIFSDSFVSSYNELKLFLHPRKCIVDSDSFSYAGALSNAMIKYPGAKRSLHPIQKFVAIGAKADLVLQHTSSSKPYSVLCDLTLLGGKNLRIGPLSKVTGVGTTHCAIEELGWSQNILKSGVCYLDDEKRLQKFYQAWPTACHSAFNNIIPLYRHVGAILGEGKIGNSDALLTDMKKTFDFEVALGTNFPHFLKCNDKGCYICRLTWKGSTGNLFSVIWNNLKRFKLKRIMLIIFMVFVKNYTIPGYYNFK